MWGFCGPYRSVMGEGMDSFNKQHGKDNNNHEQCWTRNLQRSICECNALYKLIY